MADINLESLPNFGGFQLGTDSLGGGPGIVCRLCGQFKRVLDWRQVELAYTPLSVLLRSRSRISGDREYSRDYP